MELGMTLPFSCSPVICEFRGRKPRKNVTCRKFHLFFFSLKCIDFVSYYNKTVLRPIESIVISCGIW